MTQHLPGVFGFECRAKMKNTPPTGLWPRVCALTGLSSGALHTPTYTGGMHAPVCVRYGVHMGDTTYRVLCGTCAHMACVLYAQKQALTFAGSEGECLLSEDADTPTSPSVNSANPLKCIFRNIGNQSANTY